MYMYSPNSVQNTNFRNKASNHPCFAFVINFAGENFTRLWVSHASTCMYTLTCMHTHSTCTHTYMYMYMYDVKYICSPRLWLAPTCTSDYHSVSHAPKTTFPENSLVMTYSNFMQNRYGRQALQGWSLCLRFFLPSSLEIQTWLFLSSLAAQSKECSVEESLLHPVWRRW